MKLWVDAQLSPAIARWITDNFSTIEASAIRDLGYRDAEDAVIFFAARSSDASKLPAYCLLGRDLMAFRQYWRADLCATAIIATYGDDHDHDFR
jgi:hypothetical protein